MVVKSIAEPGYLHCPLIRAAFAVKLCDASSCEVAVVDKTALDEVDTALITVEAGQFLLFQLQDKKKRLLNGQANNKSTGISLDANE